MGHGHQNGPRRGNALGNQMSPPHGLIRHKSPRNVTQSACGLVVR
jgi:hypothetical protein